MGNRKKGIGKLVMLSALRIGTAMFCCIRVYLGAFSLTSNVITYTYNLSRKCIFEQVLN